MSRTALLLVVLGLGARRDPCGTDTMLVGLNAPCQRSSDCDKGLMCVAGLCTLPEGGPDKDGTAPEAGLSGDADGRSAD